MGFQNTLRASMVGASVLVAGQRFGFCIFGLAWTAYKVLLCDSFGDRLRWECGLHESVLLVLDLHQELLRRTGRSGRYLVMGG